MTLNIPINCSPAGWDKLQRWRAEGKPGAVRDTVAVKVGTWAATEDWLRREAEKTFSRDEADSFTVSGQLCIHEPDISNSANLAQVSLLYMTCRQRRITCGSD